MNDFSLLQITGYMYASASPRIDDEAKKVFKKGVKTMLTLAANNSSH